MAGGAEPAPAAAAAEKRSARVYAAGCGHDGRLGISRSEENRSRFTEVDYFRRNGGGVLDVYAGGSHSMVRCVDGLYAFGFGEHGQLGTGSKESFRTPQYVDSLRKESQTIRAVSLGADHSLVLQESGVLWVFGKNDTGQLGDGGDSDRLHPFELEAASGARMVSAGARHSLCVVGNEVLTWGLGDQGQLGYTGDGFDVAAAKSERVRQLALKEATQRKREGVVGAGDDGPLLESGEYNPRLHPCYGKDGAGRDYFPAFCQRTPQRIPFDFGEVIAVRAGDNHTCVHTADGLYALGARLGVKRETLQDVVPTKVQPPSADVACERLLALDGMRVAVCGGGGTLSVWVKGEGLTSGELGLGCGKDGEPIEDAEEWAKVVDVPPGTQAVGRGQSVQLLHCDGTLTSFGSNFFGQLGHGHDRPSPTPQFAKIPGHVKEVAVGRNHCLALAECVDEA